MIRACLFTALALLLGSSVAHAQADMVCGGRFERFLKGFTIDVERGEMNPFLHDDEAVAACRNQLAPNNPDHTLIDAFIRLHRARPGEGDAVPTFESVCAKGRKLACAYAIFHRPRPSRPEDDDAARLKKIADIKALLGTRYPVVKYMAGMMILSASPQHPAADPKIGIKLLKQASAQGDRQATIELVVLNTDFAGAEDDPSTMPTFYLGMRKAAEQGDVAAMLKLADDSIAFGDHKTALAFYRRAATADPRWFQSMIGEACYKLGVMLRDGISTPPDAAQAQHLFDRARALGYEYRSGLPTPFDKP